ncbi:MAG: PAS domain-containing protein [Steroidobacteraceae bacterium]|jgi:two-component sensor histidine kinase|nr:PAS domain-containing protein [Steroidobacteraceae bacterium]
MPMHDPTPDAIRMAERVAGFDWAGTPLGPAVHWPQSLRTAVDLVLGSAQPMQLAWGADRIVIYNDAWVPLLAERHPGVLGRPLREACADAWPALETPMRRAAAGETVRIDRLRLEPEPVAQADERWWNLSCSPVRDESGAIAGVLSVATDATAQVHAARTAIALHELQEGRRALVAELQHRTQNLMGVVLALAERTGEVSTDIAGFRRGFGDRLQALARVQGLLSRLDDTDRITFDELIRSELAALDGAGGRVTLDGPSGVKLRSSMVQTLAMALHELAKHAVEHGALSQPGAQLRISWQLLPPDRHGRPRLEIDWRESDVAPAPAGAGRAAAGQSRELIEEALPYQLDAETAFELGPDGLRCRITLPVSVGNATGWAGCASSPAGTARPAGTP